MSATEQTGVAAPANPSLDAVPSVSVVIPCLNEAQSIERCVRDARDTLVDAALRGEVIVVDNGSEDGSGELAAAAGARVVHEPRRGYGSAYLAGFAAARGEYIVMADADKTHHWNQIPRFVEHLHAGGELGLGGREGNIQPRGKPW